MQEITFSCIQVKNNSLIINKSSFISKDFQILLFISFLIITNKDYIHLEKIYFAHLIFDIILYFANLVYSLNR